MKEPHPPRAYGRALMRRTVLVGCDAGDPDGSPAAFARTVAARLRADVVAVDVRASEALTGVEADPAPVRAPRAGMRVVGARSAAAGLQALILEERPLLAVLGSAHDAGHGRVRVGGTAERVVHGAACAVAVVPRGHGERALSAVGV